VKTYSSPFDHGKADALAGKENNNLYSQTNSPGKWAAYNTGFNLNNPKTAEYFKRQQQLKKANHA
jgi:hypothetical protein